MEFTVFIKAYLLRKLTRKNHVDFNLRDSKKVLILRYDRIGDMVVTTPLFRELKAAFPDVSISVLASKVNKDVIKYNPYISNVYTNYKNNIFKDLPTLLKLRKACFDVCIELDHSVIPHAIYRLKIINPKKIISIHKDGRYGVKGTDLELYDYFTKNDKKSHFAKIWLDTLFFFGVKPNSYKYDFFLGKIERKKAQKFSSSFGNNIKIGLNLDGSFSNKNIQKNELQQICKGLYRHHTNIIIVLLSSPNKTLQRNKMVSELGLDYVVSSYITETIIDAAAIIEKMDLIITPDTSIVHIASSFNIPVVSIHENNEDSFRLWAPSSTISKTIFSSTKQGLVDYSVNEIIESAKDILKTIDFER